MNKYKYETGGEFKEDTPKIYVADLKSYNEGRLVGQWVDLTDYDNGEEVSKKIASLMKEYSKKYHNGEETEHSIHDYENFDSSLYSEYMGEKDYDIIIDTHKISKEKGIPAEVLQSIANDFSPDDLEEFVDDRYIGEYDGDYELGENYVDNVGGIEGVSNPEFYFDYEALGRDLSINNYNEYDGHYFQNYKKGGTVKEYDLSKYAKGGEAISREKIVEVLKDELEDVLEDANQEYEGQEITGEEVEYKSRDGFIPFTDGGYEYRFFTYGNYLTGSGKSLPTNTLDAELERVENLNYEYGKERFAEEYPEIVKELGEENIDYNSLSEAGYDSEADDLDEFSRSDDDSIMFEVEAFYYNPDNSRGIDGKHTIVLTGNVNMEAPYHRTGNYEDYTQDKFTFDSIEDLKEKLQKGIDKISKWFDGDNYKEGRELKMGRFEKGGKIYKIQQKSKYDLGVPKWEDEKFQTGGKKYLSYKQAQEDKKKLQRMSSSIQYKLVEDISKSDFAKGGEVKIPNVSFEDKEGKEFVFQGGRFAIFDLPNYQGGWKKSGRGYTTRKNAKHNIVFIKLDNVKTDIDRAFLDEERITDDGFWFHMAYNSEYPSLYQKYEGKLYRHHEGNFNKFREKYFGRFYAKGGEVKKKSDNSMLIGGLAGILLGIFLGRK